MHVKRKTENYQCNYLWLSCSSIASNFPFFGISLTLERGEKNWRKENQETSQGQNGERVNNDEMHIYSLHNS